MFYKPTRQNELTRTQLESARRVFRGKLLKLRYPPQFIVRNCDELLSIAQAEYVKATERGDEIEDPAAFIVHVAWQRLKNMLHADSYRPRMVSGETVLEALPGEAPTPEEVAEASDRARKIREAVGKLTDDQRKVIALTFFEDYSVREAAKYLDWSAGKVQHHHRTALEHLRRFLPVRSSDELEVDVGMAAWLSLAGGASAPHLPAGFEAVLDKASHGASGLWARGHDLARRFSLGGGGDAAGAVASSGAGRAAGACATGLVVACVAGASGIIGPGVGTGIFGGGHQAPQHHAKTAAPKVDRAPVAQRAPVIPAAPPEATTQPTRTSASTASRSSQATNRTSARETKRKAEANRVEEQTSGIARVANESTSSASPATTSSGASGSETVTVSPESSSSSSGEETRTAKGEFQPEF